MTIARTTTALILVVILAAGLLINSGCSQPEPPTELKAVIIDQLYDLDPNQAYLDESVAVLAEYGFTTDVYRGEEVTVDLIRGIAEPGYQLIIFRAHSGLLGEEGDAIQKTCIFTAEEYSETRHLGEQLSDKLAKARINANFPWVFAVGADFVRNSIKGTFNHSVVITEGCSTLYIDDLAQAFIDKGASAYTGWTLSVGLDYVDDATAYLLQKLVKEKTTLDYAATATLNTKGRDPDFGAVLKYFPMEKGRETLSELIQP